MRYEKSHELSLNESKQTTSIEVKNIDQIKSFNIDELSKSVAHKNQESKEIVLDLGQEGSQHIITTNPANILKAPNEIVASNYLDVKPYKGNFIKRAILKKVMKQQAAKSAKPADGGKSQIVALLLCIFLGVFGIHRFYLGYTGLGVLYLFTGGIFLIGWIIDIILLLIPNGLTPKGQSSY